MGQLAVYLAVPVGAQERLAEVDEDGVVDYVEGLLEAGAPSIDIDKWWDGLHFLLTGQESGEPIEDDPLSEAVVGVYVFDSEDFLGLTPHGDLDRIIAGLEAFDLDTALATADFSLYAAADIYPNVWSDNRADLTDTLRTALTDVLNLHRLARADGFDLLVSIY